MLKDIGAARAIASASAHLTSEVSPQELALALRRSSYRLLMYALTDDEVNHQASKEIASDVYTLRAFAECMAPDGTM